jgi:hypothetical protein
MTKPKPVRRRTPALAGRDARRPLHDIATRLLADYVAAVATALDTGGFPVTQIRMGSGPGLHARLTLTPIDPRSPGIPATITLAWAEDIGWAFSHFLPTHTRWRYLHRELAPSPATVAGFVVLVLTHHDDTSMLHPARFSHHGQPLQPVIDALARRTAPARTPASAAPATRRQPPQGRPIPGRAPGRDAVHYLFEDGQHLGRKRWGLFGGRVLLHRDRHET